MIVATALALFARVDFLGFLQVYTTIYVVSAALYVLLAFNGPIRAAGAR